MNKTDISTAAINYKNGIITLKQFKTIVDEAFESQHSNNAVLAVRCRSCRWWRDKAWDGDEGIGICDNPKTIEQVSMMSEAVLSRFINDRSATRMIAQSMRFSSEFGCVNWSDGNDG